MEIVNYALFIAKLYEKLKQKSEKFEGRVRVS